MVTSDIQPWSVDVDVFKLDEEMLVKLLLCSLAWTGTLAENRDKSDLIARNMHTN
jgi:hypothetical protein